ncbi:hypothetical protein OG225_10105 [Nocardia sp. NBC_01377]|nr:hypothetical protein [Nocardia noduli]
MTRFTGRSAVVADAAPTGGAANAPAWSDNTCSGTGQISDGRQESRA